MGTSKIEWTESTWNPVTGCSPVSEGCEHCYAKRMANRLRGRYGYPQDDPFRVTIHQDKFNEPLDRRWRKPRMIFVCSMGDLFHELECEACKGTGKYGDMGPGMKGNREYQPCDYRHRFLDWVICGGETGPGARPMHPDWARDLWDQCRAAGVPFFLKQMTKKARIPDDLMIREYPEMVT